MAWQFKINYWMFTVLRISVEQNRKRIKNKIMAKPMRSVQKTWADLSNDEIFHKFFSGLLELLQNKLFKREVIGHNYTDSYYTCGQLHDRRNPGWKPFQHLEQYCERTRFDFLTVKDIIEDRIGRKFVCECQLLRDDRTRRRFELERIYGVDFSGMSGKKDFDVV